MKTISILSALFFTYSAIAGPDSLKIQKADSSTYFPIQVSFLPGIGTNGTESGNFKNNLSLNIIAGYNGGVEGLEIGLFSNTIKNDVQGIQIAGFSNQVLGKTEGIQAAGFSNFSKSNSNSVQLAGFANTNLSASNGVQLAGFSNVVRGDFNGIQGSGFSNVVTGNALAIQGSGFSNVVTGSLQGIQVSGFTNTVTDTLDGIQASGFVNVSKKKMSGMQISGFVNAAQKVDGYQLSGFANAATDVNGSQISFINVARSYEQGAPIGFLSIVKHGFHVLEVHATETMYANLTLKTGVEKFYNIFTGGYQPMGNSFAWSYGYGVGSLIKFNNEWGINTDFTASHISYGNKFERNLNLLASWQIELNYFLGQNFAFFGGASLNGFCTSKFKPESSEFYDAIIPYKTYQFNDGVIKQIYYPGVSLGVRF